MILPLYRFGPTLQQFTQMNSGNLIRYGAILKDSGTGKIVGHIQETGLWNNALIGGSKFLGGTNPALSVFNTVQNEQIKSRLNELQTMVGGLHNLQLLNLATSVVGIGVTIASTAIILNKMNELRKTTDQILLSIERIPEKWKEGRVSELMATMQTSLERLEEGHLRSNTEDIVRNVEESLHGIFNQIRTIALDLSNDIKLNTNLYRILLSALSICVGTQYKAMLYLNEKKAALLRTKNQYKYIEQLSWNLPLDVLEQKTQKDPDIARAFSGDLNKLRAHLASRPHALEILISREIHGRSIIEQAENEMAEPLLILPTSEK